jgi:hypothetical protein
MPMRLNYAFQRLKDMYCHTISAPTDHAQDFFGLTSRRPDGTLRPSPGVSWQRTEMLLVRPARRSDPLNLIQFMLAEGWCGWRQLACLPSYSPDALA